MLLGQNPDHYEGTWIGLVLLILLWLLLWLYHKIRG